MLFRSRSLRQTCPYGGKALSSGPHAPLGSRIGWGEVVFVSDVLRVIGYGLGAGLMILGGVELVRWLCFRLARGRGAGEMILLVRPTGPEDCEALVRAAALRVDWMDLRPPCRLACIDPGGETGAILERLERQCHSLERLGPEELARALAGESPKEGK